MVVGAGQHERDKMYFINDAEIWEGFISTLSPSCIDLIFISKTPEEEQPPLPPWTSCH